MTIWNEEKIKEFVENKGYVYIRMVEKHGKHSRIIVWCGIKEHPPYEVDFNNFYRNRRCSLCRNEENSIRSTKWTKEKIITYIENYDYKFIEFTEYKGVYSFIKIQCNKQHEPYIVCFHNFENSENRCPYCSRSKGNEKTANILNKYKIEYKEEYRFDDCRNKNPLPFDFYLPKYNCCIEFDGEQHFRPMGHKGGLEKFLIRKHNDKIKNKYCMYNHIKLIRISYWDIGNIEDILIRKLNL